MKKVIILSILVAFSSLQIKAQQVRESDWPNYNRTLAGDRFSPLTQFTKENVSKLKLVATFDLASDINSFQTGPVVLDGKMYFTSDTVTYAINAATGKLLWKKVRSNTKTRGYGANRGVAYLDGKLFRGSSDAHFFAMDAKDGKILWETDLGSGTPGAAIPMAPLVWNNLIFVGIAGGDQVGVVGYVYALDAKTGKTVWTFCSVPDYKENPKTSTGLPVTGGGYWTSFGLDTEKGVLYVPSGNPAPDMDIEIRGEDRKFFNYLIALDTKTGKLLGYKQLVRNDIHDWDVSAPPVIINTKEGRKIVASANKNGLLSVLDRSAVDAASAADPAGTLPLIYEVPTTTRINTDVSLSREVLTYFKPGYLGGSEWNGPAYNPLLDVIYTGTTDWGLKVKLPPYEKAITNIPAPGATWFGPDSIVWDDASEAKGWLKAFNAKDGSLKWEYHSPGPVLSGVTPTASGLLFTSSMNGDIYAFDAENGKILWQTNTGLINGGGVITYLVNGKQYLAVTGGMKSDLWKSTAKVCKMFIFALN
ncbi:pyrroloquinoline quinone-dependent dehydrogenase [Limibacterium fermenti]|uniref:pyrroloquinoline quinone-dependent dehydrogenase n=1 Tax=Limibacterium fermenti TaxID=3229863 RepID=UPI0026C2A69B